MTTDTRNEDVLPAAAEVAALLAIGEARTVREPITNPDGSVTYFVAEGMKAVTVQALSPALPDFVTQTETMIEPKSFIDYLIQFKSPTAVCRASLGQNSIVAVLDYHGRARTGEALGAVPGRGKHMVTLHCPFDADYAKWRVRFGKLLDQKSVIEFIEEMIHTIGAPPAAELLEALGDIEIERVVKFKSARNDKNGNISFGYEEKDGETSRSGQYSLPDHIVIVVPIFQGGNPIQLTAKLRFRMKDGDLTLGFAVPGIENIEREAFRSIGESVRAETDTPVFYIA